MSRGSALELSLELVEVPIILTTKKGPQYWIMRELDGTARDSYLQSLASKMTMRGGKVDGLRDFNGVQAALLVKGMHRVPEPGDLLWWWQGEDSSCRPDRNLVPVLTVAATMAEVQSWPSRVQDALLKQLKDLSGLEDNAEENAKNDSQASGNTGTDSPSGSGGLSAPPSV
jgi:hypothetical protein